VLVREKTSKENLPIYEFEFSCVLVKLKLIETNLFLLENGTRTRIVAGMSSDLTLWSRDNDDSELLLVFLCYYVMFELRI
jgi:hypothetical protein